MRMRNKFWIFVLIAAGFVTAVPAQDRSAEKPLVPNLIFKTRDAKDWSLAENRGSVVVLNFWATWCEPCRTEVPYLVKIASELESRGVTVVGVSLDEPGSEIVNEFAAEYNINYPILFPEPDSPMSKIENLPVTLLVGRDGRLVKKYTGAVPEKVLRADIEKLLTN